MSGNLRDINELETELEGLPLRGMSKQNYLDILRSLAKVGGCLNINKGTSPDQDITIAAGWNRIDVWETSRDTQGVQDGLADVPPAGRFKIKNAGSGDYSITAPLRFTVDTDGLYEVRIEQVGSDETTITNTLYQDAVALVAGEQGHVMVTGLIKNVLAQEYLQLSIKGPNDSIVTVNYGQFSVQR